MSAVGDSAVGKRMSGHFATGRGSSVAVAENVTVVAMAALRSFIQRRRVQLSPIDVLVAEDTIARSEVNELAASGPPSGR